MMPVELFGEVPVGSSLSRLHIAKTFPQSLQGLAVAPDFNALQDFFKDIFGASKKLKLLLC